MSRLGLSMSGRGTKRNPERRYKIFQYKELGEYYGVTPQTVIKWLRGEDLRTLGSVVRAIRILDKRYM